MALLAEWYCRLHERPWRRAFLRFLYSSRNNIGLRITARHMRRVAGYFMHHADALDPETFVEIRYEDLCQSPDKTIDGILSFLGLRDGSPVDYRALVRPRHGDIPPRILEYEGYLHRSMSTYYAHCRYDRDGGRAQ